MDQAREEARIAEELLAADTEARRALYASAYDRIYRMHLETRGTSIDEQTFGATPGLVGLLVKLTHRGDDVLEVGCGAGMLSIALADRGRRVTGVDVSEVILEEARRHAAGAVDLRRVDGVFLPFADESFDFVYSVEVLEHLHEEDARAHLREVRRVLRRGGAYWLLTPNGRYPIDRWGVDTDANVHLKEWTYGELRVAARDAGFTNLRSPWRNQSLHSLPLVPLSWAVLAERLPRAFAKLAGSYVVSAVLR
jgi:2-polyprenyl-3-methyl-5-hydroxy-6-metoxy-1,4-benzoquinol methylase